MKNHRPDFILRMLCYLVLLLTAMACTSQSNSKKTSSSISSRLDFDSLVGDTVVYTGAIHNAINYVEDENCIISMKLLSDTTLLCKLTKKTEVIEYLTKPLCASCGNTIMHLVNPSGATYESYIPHSPNPTGKVQVSETVEAIYDLHNTLTNLGLGYYIRKDDFFVQNGDYEIQWEFFYWIDSKTKRSLKTPPLIFHNTISQDSLKVLEGFR